MNIKTKILEINAKIISLQAQIQIIQKECLHTETHIGIYSWRVGVQQPAIICSTCGKLIKITE